MLVDHLRNVVHANCRAKFIQIRSERGEFSFHRFESLNCHVPCVDLTLGQLHFNCTLVLEFVVKPDVGNIAATERWMLIGSNGLIALKLWVSLVPVDWQHQHPPIEFHVGFESSVWNQLPTALGIFGCWLIICEMLRTQLSKINFPKLARPGLSLPMAGFGGLNTKCFGWIWSMTIHRWISFWVWECVLECEFESNATAEFGCPMGANRRIALRFATLCILLNWKHDNSHF